MQYNTFPHWTHPSEFCWEHSRVDRTWHRICLVYTTHSNNSLKALGTVSNQGCVWHHKHEITISLTSLHCCIAAAADADTYQDCWKVPWFWLTPQMRLVVASKEKKADSINNVFHFYFLKTITTSVKHCRKRNISIETQPPKRIDWMQTIDPMCIKPSWLWSLW